MYYLLYFGRFYCSLQYAFTRRRNFSCKSFLMTILCDFRRRIASFRKLSKNLNKTSSKCFQNFKNLTEKFLKLSLLRKLFYKWRDLIKLVERNPWSAHKKKKKKLSVLLRKARDVSALQRV